VLAPQEPGRPRRILSLGEAKLGEVMGGYHVQQLARARDLLSASYDTSGCVLACYSAAGFHEDLRTARDPRLALITLNDIYDRNRPARAARPQPGRLSPVEDTCRGAGTAAPSIRADAAEWVRSNTPTSERRARRQHDYKALVTCRIQQATTCGSSFWWPSAFPRSA
jgi:hypothetical protein